MVSTRSCPLRLLSAVSSLLLAAAVLVLIPPSASAHSDDTYTTRGSSGDVGRFTVGEARRGRPPAVRQGAPGSGRDDQVLEADRGAPSRTGAPTPRAASDLRVIDVGLATYPGVVSGDSVAVIPVSEDGQNAGDLNGDADVDDFVWHIYERVAGVTNLALALPWMGSGSDPVVFDGAVGFLVGEGAQGGTDLNGDGEVSLASDSDQVVHVYEPTSGVSNVGLVGASLAGFSGGFGFLVDEAAQGSTDLNGDGDALDRVVHVYESGSGVTNLGIASQWSGSLLAMSTGFAFRTPDAVVHVYDTGASVTNLGVRGWDLRQSGGGDGIGFFVFEADGPTDLNGDGDTDDGVVHVYEAGSGLVNLQLAGEVCAAFGAGLAAVVKEPDQGNSDLNGDGDQSDWVAHVYEPATGVTNLGLAVESAGSWDPCDGFGTSAGPLAFTVDEFSHGATDLNGDGDTDDNVVHAYEAATGATNLGLVSWIRQSAPLGGGFAFLVIEDQQAVVQDLNGDGDVSDAIVHLYDATAGVTNLGYASDGSLAPFDGGLAFGVMEWAQGNTDLNGDGDDSDSVIHAVDTSGIVTNLGLAGSAGSPLEPAFGSFAGGFAFIIWETGQGGTDLNGDGDAADTVAHVAVPDIYPIATDDDAFVAKGGVLDEPAPGVLANDFDPDGEPLTAAFYTDPSHGTLTMFVDGSFTYTHDGSNTTTDAFSYWASDGVWLSNVATVWITINDPPIAADDGPYAVSTGGTLVELPPGLLANDVDPDGDPLTAAFYTDPSHGAVTMFVDGSFIYTHDGSNTTSDAFTYWASDGIWVSNEATVSITVHPVIDLELSKNVAPAQVTVGEQTTFTISVSNQGPSDATGVTVRDSLPAALTYVSDSGGGSFDPATGVWTVGDLTTSATANLELVVTVDQVGAYANVAEVAAANEPDVDSTPNNNDPAEDDIDAADITAVAPPNNPPIAVDDGPYTVAQGDTLTVNGVLDNDSDADGDPLTATKVSDPAHGTLTLNRNGSFVYVHDGTATTADSFKYRASDGEADSNIATVSITITPVQVLPGTLEPTSVGLVDASQGKWYLRDYDTGAVVSFFYGDPGDIPFMGDWNCDGEATPGLFRQSDAYAYLRNSNTVGIADIRFYFGDPDDVPLAGDFNGDGCDTLSIYRPSEQRFYIINELGENEGGLGAAEYAFTFGNPGDKPVAGDWDGDRTDEIGLHRESTGFFYYRNTLDVGIADGQFYFGDPGDRFVAGDWGTIDGVETPAVFRPGNTTFYFRWTNTPGAADSEFVWGETGWLPVSGVLD